MRTKTSEDLIDVRVRRFAVERLAPASHLTHAPVTIEAWTAPGEPVPFEEAIRQEFRPFTVGTAWGRPWGTTWFRIAGTVPAQWGSLEGLGDGDIELVVDLGFAPGQVGFQAEALAWTTDGRTIKAIEPENSYVTLDARPGEPFELYLEAASNPDVGCNWLYAPTPLGRWETAGDDPIYVLRRLEIAVRDREAWELAQDVKAAHGLAVELPADSPRRAALFAALDRAVDAVDPTDVSGTAADGRAALAGVLAQPANASAHTVYAVGHAHIDSAWLWPVRETVRKCARTFSNVLALMDADPDLVFACSSAQQFAWIQEYYPELFERIAQRVAEGRFVPVGSMWVESDTNMPGSEAMARQFVEGKRYFLDAFGVDTKEVWLPDSFGYTAALPQIARAAGADAFLTQKISWNETNTFPHHTFYWEGIDGTRILTHFPPVDTYNSDLSAADLARAERQFADKDRANTSLVPFGWGDGGGGPTREMMAAARRTADLEGSPRVRVSSPAQFFAAARAELADPAVWAGELYLEFHRGTYTSQARTKQGNRRGEALLHTAELWAATAAVRAGYAYPADRLREAWRTVLLGQFHDILPGSCIGWVYDDYEQRYAEVARVCEEIIAGALGALGVSSVAGAGGVGPEGSHSPSLAGARSVVDVLRSSGPTPASADERTTTDAGHDNSSGGSVLVNSSPLPVAGVPAYGVGVPSAVAASTRVTAVDGGYVLDNGRLRVQIDADGLVPSVVELASGREVVAPGTRANLLQIFRDTPRQWDAWDVDVEYRRMGQDLVAADEVELLSGAEAADAAAGAGAAAVRVRRSFGKSVVTQVLSLTPGADRLDITTTVDWHERQRMLKLAFPIDVHTTSARSEIQFGHIERPTHTNTSWDTARFETCAHRWVHVADATFGAGVANDSTYGHDITRHERAGGGTYSVVRQSLLRAPLYPDPEADQGTHTLRSALVVGGVEAAIRAGYELNLPARPALAADTAGTSATLDAGTALAVEPLVTSTNPAIVVETVKLAEDGSGDVVVRAYESLGARAAGRLTFGFAHGTVTETDLLERDVAASALAGSHGAAAPAGPASAGADGVELSLRPFQLVTIRVARA